MHGFGRLGRQSNKTKSIIAVTAILFVAALTAGYAIYKIHNDRLHARDSDATTRRILEKVDAIYNLPRKERPVIAEIKDTTRLTEKPFFNEAQNGDYLIVYSQSELALLYRESLGKLINVGPVNLNEAAHDVRSAGIGTPTSR